MKGSLQSASSTLYGSGLGQRLAPFAKRGADVAIALLLLILLAPLLVVIAITMRILSAERILYSQERTGLNGRPFWVLKFRTLLEQDSTTCPHDLGSISRLPRPASGRQTSFGRILRRTSLDELPQLINVLRGEMSLVGPRPFSSCVFSRMKPDDPEFKRWYRLRHQVLPGLSGMWQVEGRGDLSFEDLYRLDREYVENKSLLLDAKIMLKTIPAVIRGRGAY